MERQGIRRGPQRTPQKKKAQGRGVGTTQEQQPPQAKPAPAKVEQPTPVIVEQQPKEQLPTRKPVSPIPPDYTEDEKEIKRSDWSIEGRVPVPFMNKWIKTKNLARDLSKGWGIEPYQINKELFIENYEEAAQMYREQAAKYNKGTI